MVNCASVMSDGESRKMRNGRGLGAIPPAPGTASATATQLVRDFPEVRRLAEHGPVHITSHGRTELVMLSPDAFAKLAAPGDADAARLEWQLSVVLDAVETRIAILDQDLLVRRANPTLCSALGRDEADLIGRHVSTLSVHPSDRYVVERVAEVQRSGQAEILTVPSAQHEGRIMRIAIRPWPRGVAVFADDVTERTRLGDAQVATDAVETALAGLGGVGTAHVRSCGTILSSGRGLARMAGASAESLVGLRLQRLLTPQSRAMLEDVLHREEPQRLAVEYLRNGMTAAPASLVVTPYWIAEHHACAAVVLHDPDWQDA